MNPQFVQPRPPLGSNFDGSAMQQMYPPQGVYDAAHGFPVRNGPSQPPPMGAGPQGMLPSGPYPPPSQGKPAQIGQGSYFAPLGVSAFQAPPNVAYQNGASPTPPPSVQQPYAPRMPNNAPGASQGVVPGPAVSQGQPIMPPQHFRPPTPHNQPSTGMPPQLINQMSNMSIGNQNLGPPSMGASGPPAQMPQQIRPSLPPASSSSSSSSTFPNYGPPPAGTNIPRQDSHFSNPPQGPLPSASSVSPGVRPPQIPGPPPGGFVQPSSQLTNSRSPPQAANGPPFSGPPAVASYPAPQHLPPSSTAATGAQPVRPIYPPGGVHSIPPPPTLSGPQNVQTLPASSLNRPQFETVNGPAGHLSALQAPPSAPPPSSTPQFNLGSAPFPAVPNAPSNTMAHQYPGPNQSRYPAPAVSGVPPQPGVNQGYSGMPQAPGPMPAAGPIHQPQQQQRRLDPEMMPSPIQVMEDDKKAREGIFCTNLRGQLPPLVTTNFLTQDQGNCNPRFMRASMYTVPSSPDMMKQTAIPFTLSISPFAKLLKEEHPPPIVQLGELGPVRCIRCKAYICPFMQFVDGGRRFQCSFCRATTEVPPEYFAHLDHTGQRVDKYERPELCLGSYEFIATKDYCKNNIFPLPPAFIFLIDVSYNNIKNGVVHLLCQNMKNVLSHLPRENEAENSQIKVGFITYSNSVHFYNLKSCLAQPQVMVVPDVQDMFMPLLDGFLVGVEESETIIDSLMEQIPQMYAESRETETILGPAIKAGLEALKAADRAGKLFVFHSSLPIGEAPGKLKNRDERKLLGTDKEKTVLAPQTTFYNQLGQECVAAGCSVDIFTFPNAYIDIATIGQVCRLTGGQIHKYMYFVANIDGDRLIGDLHRAVSHQVAFDAIMRVRTSTGIRPTDFFGNYFMSNTTDVELAAVDTDKGLCVEIKHDDKLTDEEAVYIQTAILYTSVGGQRRLRIHNLSLNTCSQMADLYRNCELDTLMNYFSKACLRQLCDQPPKQVKENLINKCAQNLACYRKNCASPSSAGQLILPECMKLLPLYVNCLLKCDAVSGGSDMTTDDRSFAMHVLNSMDIRSSLAFIYPRLLPLHNLDPNSRTMPTSLRCTVEKLRDTGVYLLENGIYMFIWIGMNADSSWLHDVFGVQSAAQIDIEKASILELDNPTSQCVRHVINQVREERQRHMKIIVVLQCNKLEALYRHFLVEDKGMDGSPSYVDFLCHVHKEIRNLLS